MTIKFVQLPSKARLDELLDYNPGTGLFHWKVHRGGRAQKGSVAGRLDKWGYRQIKVDGHMYLASRMAFKIVNGRDPLEELDHVNAERGDDRISNLREATREQNVCNTKIRSNNKSGLKGVHWFKPAKKWVASIRIRKKKYHLGYFENRHEAHKAYCDAAERLHGEFARIS